MQSQEADEHFPQIARDWVVRLASGEITPAEIDRFKAWLAADTRHREAFNAARALWQRAGAVKDAFAEVRPDLARPVTVLSARPRTRRAPLAAAIGLVAACALLFIAFDDLKVAVQADYRTGAGQQQSVALPDGSTVYLNTETAIAVQYSAGERRIALLRGEALFEVASDAERPFRVSALGGITQAIGTAFVVREGDSRVRVSITHGHVAIASPAKTITPGEPAVDARKGERVIYAEGQRPQLAGRIDAEAAAAWRDGKIVFDGLPFAAAIAEIDRYLPGRIVVWGDPASYRPVSGVFAINQIESALAGIAATQGLSVTRFTDYLVILR